MFRVLALMIAAAIVCSGLTDAVQARGLVGGAGAGEASSLAGLHAPSEVTWDVDGVPHILAYDEHDALFMQGFLQAQDRLFQLDILRRTASGTLSELRGTSALGSDINMKILGLRRAAESSFAAYSSQTRAGLQAYADGVNASVARNALPEEYAALEITRFEPWTAIDSVSILALLTFQLSFSLDLDATLTYNVYQDRLTALDPQNGEQLAYDLYFQDVFRAAPFDLAATVPDAGGPGPRKGMSGRKGVLKMHPDASELLRRYRRQIENIPILEHALSRGDSPIGSNEWAVSGRLTRNGRPLIANDPHLSLGMPANFYDLHLRTLKGDLDVIGSSMAGTPWILLGQNKFVTWGETSAGFDVTDTYVEQLVADATSPSGISSLHEGQLEHVLAVPLQFRANLRDGGSPDTIAPVPAGNGVPAGVFLIPRRNNGPIVQLDSATGVAVSVQYTGFGATREFESFRLMNRARTLQDFKAALQFFDVGAQNFIYGDIWGNIGFFAAGKVPLREDLQAGTINGAPPWFVRNGQGGNEWLRESACGPGTQRCYQYLPFNELPQSVNPSRGFIVNANNDSAGLTLDNNPVDRLRKDDRGVYYLGYTFDDGTRAGRITQVLRETLARGPVDRRAMQTLQSDTVLPDAQVFAPYVVKAFANARAGTAPPALQVFAADAQVEEAVGRFARWRYTTPTGVSAGYDAADKDGALFPPTSSEVQESIAATIYAVWRGRAIANGIDKTLIGLSLPGPGQGYALKTLRHLIERDGIGVSTVDFFKWAPLPEAAQRRDFVLLQSLREALNELAGPRYANAYRGSTNQEDYRWGRLHRITFNGLQGAQGSIPGADPQLPPSFPDLPGLAVDGGLNSVDVAPHQLRPVDGNSFTFNAGANRRYVGSPGVLPGSIEAETILPGGNSGRPGNEFYANQLGRWLTNESYSMRQSHADIVRSMHSRRLYLPKRGP